MTKVRRPILLVINILLLVLGVAALAAGIGLSTLPTAQFSSRTEEQVAAEVERISDVRKLRARVENAEGYLHSFAGLVESGRDTAFWVAAISLGFGALNLALIPWRLKRNELSV